ncbi:MAG: pesticidal protein Cry7Aa [Saprospiraceae bacterium]|nr:pesticidal protein Cry7Aa [Saprospiraceae bacterium]
MIQVTKHGVILEKTNLDFENEGVLNPGAIVHENQIHLFYRAVRFGNHSTIGYCILDTPLTVVYRLQTPLIEPEHAYESKGLEDPRIVKIDDTFYLTYTAYNGTNALGAVATSKDLKVWDKKGIIVPQITYETFRYLAETNGSLNGKYLRYNEHIRSLEAPHDEVLLWDKNLIFFPRRIKGKLCFLHRIKPDVQILIAIDELSDLTKEFWHQYITNIKEHIVLTPIYNHEVSYIGGGCPPIETASGWLIIYHGVHDSVKGFVYSACAALLDLDDPQKEIARLPYPLFFPEFAWELKGEVNNVCFPTGVVVINEILYIYYGAADERIACASVNINILLDELKLNTK